VFLDPPYGSGRLGALCAMLDGGGWLLPDARIYLEDAAAAGAPALPAGWRILRSARAGNVGYHLAAGPSGDRTGARNAGDNQAI
jgi:16S rRNA G966 N2-methylase RsmD